MKVIKALLLEMYNNEDRYSLIDNFILFGIEATSPTISAVVIVLLFEKKAGIKKFFARIFHPN